MGIFFFCFFFLFWGGGFLDLGSMFLEFFWGDCREDFMFGLGFAEFSLKML